MTEDNFIIDINDEEYESVDILDLESGVKLDESVHIIEVVNPDQPMVETFDAFNAIGEPNEQLRHQLLNGRDVADQHPITAITGLKGELDNIKALKTVYSDEKQFADYYEWEDRNVLQENRIGYFVSACSNTNHIKICTDDNNIFGVTVVNAGFVGAQSNIARDIRYGLVITTGIVHVRCEISVNIGDYVVSNNYGYAKKSKNGYKVVGRHQINGIEYAEITLVTPISKICELTDNVENLGDRMDDAEANIAAAMYVANEAYNKAGEVSEISEEAIKNALEALDKAGDALDKTDGFESRLTSTNEMAVQAQAISQSAVSAAEKIRKEAVATANDALTKVNNTQDNLDELINNMDPLITWEGDNGRGISGFVQQVEADRITLGNLSKWEDDESGAQSLSGIITTVGKHEAILTGFTGYDGELKETIAQVEQKADDNGASITSIVSSIDKYSVGEFSQAYGLTREQAKSILKPGYIYIPTEHKDKQSHSETMWENSEEKEKGEEGRRETNEFTPGDYYVWGINDQGNVDWIEHSVRSVWISDAIPANSDGKLKYWYINSNTPPQNYEAYALYIWEDEQWKKVNILDGNVTNRVVSMVQQTQNKISLEITNARGSATSINERISEDEATVQSLALWSKGGDEDGEQYNLATIKQTADGAGASIAQVVESVGVDGKVNAASIVAAINNTTGDSIVKIDADHVVVDGSHISLKGQTINISSSDVLGIQSPYFSVNTDGYMTATGGTIGGWKIEASDKSEKFGKVLFIGDSYTYDYSCIETDEDGNRLTNADGTYKIKEGYEQQFRQGWPEYCAKNLGLSANDYYDAGRGGYGFLTGSNQNLYFYTLLNEGIDYVVQTKGWSLSEISHIVIGGGFNDKTVNADSTYGRTVNDIKNAIITLNNRVATLFSGYTKPKIILFAMGRSATSTLKNNDLEKYVYPTYKEQSTALGWTFYDIHNFWGGENNANYCSDNIHPNTNGVKKLGEIVASNFRNIKGKLYNRSTSGANSFTSGISVESTAPGGVALWAGYSGYYNTPYEDYVAEGSNSKWSQKTPFYVTNNGYLYAQNANIEGTISAESGKIGGWNISSTYLNQRAYNKLGDGYTWLYSMQVPSSIGSAVWLIGRSNITGNYTTTSPSEWIYPFRVTAEGKLYATNAEIKGKIEATSGSFSDNITIGGTAVTASDLRKLYSYATGGSGIAITQVAATNGSINFDKYFSVSDSGAAQMSNDGGGFLTLGGNTTHPYVSALNVAAGGGGINFLDSGGQDEVGTSHFRMKLVEDAYATGGHSINIVTAGNIRINTNYTGITGQVKIITGIRSSIYIAFYKGFVVGCSNDPIPNFEILAN